MSKECSDPQSMEGAARPRLVLVVESTSRGNGGIARVARLLAWVAEAEQREGRLRAELVVLSAADPDQGWRFPIHLAHGSRARFVAQVHRSALWSTHVLYDFPNMARAHSPVLRLLRPYMTGLMGVEIWPGGHHPRRRAAERARSLWAISAFTRDVAARTLAWHRDIPVCWLATEEDDAPEAAANTSRANVAIVARLEMTHGGKGHRELIEAWPSVVQRVPGARLLVVGTGGGESELRAMAACSSERDSIEFRGYVPEEEMPALWAEASVLAMPSRREGFGLAYIEAMRHSLPVVASVHDAGREVNIHGETGFNVNLEDPTDLPNRLCELLLNPELRARMGENGERRWYQHFRRSCFISRFRPILHDFLKPGHRQPPGAGEGEAE